MFGKRSGLLCLWVLFFFVFATSAPAQIPKQIQYQGVLTNNTGVPLDGTFIVTFRIYDAPTAGTVLWTETHPSVAVDQGLFNVLLGSITTLDLSFDQPNWLSIQVGADPEMTPRQFLATVPTAIRAETAEGVAPGGLDPLYIAPPNVGIGIASPGYPLDVAGDARATGSVRTSVVYDEDNPIYYLNPDGISSLYGIKTGFVYAPCANGDGCDLDGAATLVKVHCPDTPDLMYALSCDNKCQHGGAISECSHFNVDGFRGCLSACIDSTGQPCNVNIVYALCTRIQP